MTIYQCYLSYDSVWFGDGTFAFSQKVRFDFLRRSQVSMKPIASIENQFHIRQCWKGFWSVKSLNLRVSSTVVSCTHAHVQHILRNNRRVACELWQRKYP